MLLSWPIAQCRNTSTLPTALQPSRHLIANWLSMQLIKHSWLSMQLIKHSWVSMQLIKHSCYEAVVKCRWYEAVMRSQSWRCCNSPWPFAGPCWCRLSSPAAWCQIWYKRPQLYSSQPRLHIHKSTDLHVAHEFLVDEAVFGQTVEVDAAELFDLADLKVEGAFCGEQNTVLAVVEPGQPTLHLVFGSVLADVLELNG